jgi:LPXTG-motif cell wall-anchored protein
MKITKIIFGLLFVGFIGNAGAANITLYYSPTCPHCHHAREFISNELVYVYNDLQVTAVNVMNQENRQKFFDTLKKCEFKSGGVPVLVIGEKCFQGYGNSMQQELRDAIEIDYTDAQKKSAIENKTEFDKNHDDFIKTHSNRLDAIVEFDGKKKLNNKSFDTTNIILVGLLILLLGGLVLLFKKQK